MGNKSTKTAQKAPVVEVTASPSTLHEHTIAKLKEHGKNVAQVDAVSGESITFDAILERAAALAAGLSARGLRPGGVAMVIGENSVNYPWVVLGVLQTGAAAHLVDPRSNPREVEHAVSISCPQVALLSAAVSKDRGVSSVFSSASCVQHVLMWSGEAAHGGDLPEGVASLELLLVSPARSAAGSSICTSPSDTQTDPQPQSASESAVPNGCANGTVLSPIPVLLDIAPEGAGASSTPARPAAPPPTPTSLNSPGAEVSPLQQILSFPVDGVPASVEQVSGDSVALILSSSGSTGLPKGVMLTHDNVLAALQQGPSFVEKGDVVLGLSPYFHAYGSVLMLMALCAGVRVVAMGKFSLGALVDAVEKHGVTVIHTVPSLMVSLVKYPDLDASRLSSLKRVWTGAAQVSPLVQSALQGRLPAVKLFHSYGMTETTFTTFTGEVRADKPGSPGTLAPGMDCRVIDPDSGKTVVSGSRGELCFKGAMVMKGYLSNEEATKEVLDSQGWLRSGDLGYIDEDGYCYIIERLKDVLKFNGHQVSPSELEALLLTHPAVRDAAVIGIPHEFGDAPQALIVLAEGATVSAEELQANIAGKVASHKQLRGGVKFVDSFPKTASGKLQRRKLRALFVDMNDSSSSEASSGDSTVAQSATSPVDSVCSPHPETQPQTYQQEQDPAEQPQKTQAARPPPLDLHPEPTPASTELIETEKAARVMEAEPSAMGRLLSDLEPGTPLCDVKTPDWSAVESPVCSTPDILAVAATIPLPLSEPTTPATPATPACVPSIEGGESTGLSRTLSNVHEDSPMSVCSMIDNKINQMCATPDSVSSVASSVYSEASSTPA